MQGLWKIIYCTVHETYDILCPNTMGGDGVNLDVIATKEEEH